MRAAEEAGYEVACACSGPGPWQPLSLPREPVYATTTSLRLRLKMAGLYGPAHALVGDRSRTTYKLGDTVAVKLAEAAPLTGGLRFDLAEGSTAARDHKPRFKTAPPHKRRRK